MDQRNPSHGAFPLLGELRNPSHACDGLRSAVTGSDWTVIRLRIVPQGRLDGGANIGSEIAPCLPTGAVLADEPAGAGSAAEFAHLPPERGRFDAEGVDEFRGGDELAPVVVEIGAEVLDYRCQRLGQRPSVRCVIS